jgi:hypothetical protein
MLNQINYEGFEVSGFRFGVWGLGFGVWGLRFEVWGSQCLNNVDLFYTRSTSFIINMIDC